MHTPRQLRIDFMYLDLTTCTRCRGTDQSLESALAKTHEVLSAAGTEVELNKIQVESVEQAHELRFRSSPTIRVNGRDIALELRESSCGAEACTDGCGDDIACRVWLHEGQEHTEAPVAMIVDAILREAYSGETVDRRGEAEPYRLPENLDRFFTRSGDGGAAAPVTEEACCSPAEKSSCCDPEDKAECCGASAAGTCGCR